jgi:predicted CopG family antitoxin
MVTPVKTTVILRDEVYEYLIRKFGRRKISEAINQALMKELFKPAKSMFGADGWLTTQDLRDEEEPHETP